MGLSCSSCGEVGRKRSKVIKILQNQLETANRCYYSNPYYVSGNCDISLVDVMFITNPIARDLGKKIRIEIDYAEKATHIGDFTRSDLRIKEFHDIIYKGPMRSLVGGYRIVSPIMHI